MTPLAQAKIEIADAAVHGINEFLRSTRGARMLGADAHADLCDDSKRTVQVTATVDGVPTMFEFTVRELYGVGM